MSFWDKLRKVGRAVVTVEHAVAPIASAFFPQFAAVDAIVTRVQGAIITAEANIPQDGQGALKAQAVIGDFEAGLDIAQSIAAARGKRLEYDKAALQEAINGFVAGYNGMAKVKASFKEVDATA